MSRKIDLLRILSRIEKEIPEECAWSLRRLELKSQKPFLWVLWQIMLSHQTTMKQEDIAIERLWSKYDSLESMAVAKPKEIEPLIANVGIGKGKAQRIIEATRILKDRFQTEENITQFLGNVPVGEGRDMLVSLPGVGPKTAAIVLLTKSDKPMFPVDTNIWRVARELGWIPKNGSAEQVRSFVEKRLPSDPDLYKKAHAYLLALGRVTQRGRRKDLIDALRRSTRL